MDELVFKFEEYLDETDADINIAAKDVLTYVTDKWTIYANQSDYKVFSKEKIKCIFENLCTGFRTLNGCNSLADVATLSGYQEVGEEVILVKGSNSFLVKSLLASLPSNILKCQQKVTKVEWQTGENESKKLAKVVSTDKDGKEHEYFADHVIATFPLGYLKKHHADIFSPPLPQNKIQAINRYDFFVTKGCAFFFSEGSLHQSSLIMSCDPELGRKIIWVRTFCYSIGEKVVFCFE